MIGIEAAPVQEADHDLELATRWSAGDREAGERLFERHYAAVARFFSNKVGLGATASDLVQKTFLACLEGLSRFRGDGSFRSYLFSIAYRVLCRHYRARRRKPQHFDFTAVSVHDLDPSPSRVVAQREEQRVLLEGLRRLPLDDQVLLELIYWESITVAQAAVILETPLGTTKSRLLRARRRLERALEELAHGSLLASTRSALDDWARGIREQALGGDDST